MGKQGKKQQHHQKNSQRRAPSYSEDHDDDDTLPTSAYNLPNFPAAAAAAAAEEEEEEEEEEKQEDVIENQSCPINPLPSKFDLYQKSVQSPRGDISYLQKFFLLYVGGRLPLHFQEDFCGTALLSTEWLCTDPRRTAVGLDLDHEALTWCLENNLNKIGPDGYSRLSLFHGNVLQPFEASLVRYKLPYLMKNINLNGHEECLVTAEQLVLSTSTEQTSRGNSTDDEILKKSCSLPPRDIVCAFNYSCCCLQRRKDLVLYFKHALGTLSREGGIFVMDLYGGTSSECKLRLKRRFSNFTYIWEQTEFDIVNRTTRISLHFQCGKRQQTLRHAFSYNWRLWSLPEIKDCLEEAGFRSVHVWIREMPDTLERGNAKEYNGVRDVKYKEVLSFEQQDAWNAYIVAVAN